MANEKNTTKGGITEEVAERTGLEPATPGVTGRYSNQLNYRSTLSFKSCDLGNIFFISFTSRK